MWWISRPMWLAEAIRQSRYLWTMFFTWFLFSTFKFPFDQIWKQQKLIILQISVVGPIWDQSNCKKPNCRAACDSRLRLTSQMGCNCLINPMFVSFYAFCYGLFSLHALSSVGLPSLGGGEGVCQKHFCCLATVNFSQGVWSRTCCVLPGVGQLLPWQWLEQRYLPRLSAMPLQSHSSPFPRQRCVINAALLSSVQWRRDASLQLWGVKNQCGCFDTSFVESSNRDQPLLSLRYPCSCSISLLHARGCETHWWVLLKFSTCSWSYIAGIVSSMPHVTAGSLSNHNVRVGPDVRRWTLHLWKPLTAPPRLSFTLSQ